MIVAIFEYSFEQIILLLTLRIEVHRLDKIAFESKDNKNNILSQSKVLGIPTTKLSVIVFIFVGMFSKPIGEKSKSASK